MVSPEEALMVVLEVIRPLDRLGVPYAVGGSLASSFHGIPRTTQDADLVADLRPQHVQPLVAELSQTFYISPERAAHAVSRRSSFNIVHLATGIKVDIFILKGEPLALQEMLRRKSLPVPGSGVSIQVASAEDTILQKLQWYRLGNQVSERQWQDVLGVLKISGKDLDHDYLKEWAARIGVEDLLREALDDAGLGG
ncbi:MAG: hypothetical protein ACJ75H_15035 [Thermoanaerobaculia bacterium]